MDYPVELVNLTKRFTVKKPQLEGMKTPQLERLVHDSYQFLFGLDEDGSIYDDPIFLTDLLSSKIVDETTLFAIDISDLFDAINHTQTRTGAATLFRSLLQPLGSLELIREKQNSVKELENDEKLRKELEGG